MNVMPVTAASAALASADPDQPPHAMPRPETEVSVDAKDDDRIQQAVKEAKELIKMLEATSVRRVSLEIGTFKIEIERAFAEAGAAAAVSVRPAGAAGEAPAKDPH